MLMTVLRVAFGSVFSSLTSLVTVTSIASIAVFGSYWYGRYDAYRLYQVEKLRQENFELQFELDNLKLLAKASDELAKEQSEAEAHNARVDFEIEHQIAASPNPPSCTSANFLQRLHTIK